MSKGLLSNQFEFFLLTKNTAMCLLFQLETKETIVISGAGLAGSLQAVYFAQMVGVEFFFFLLFSVFLNRCQGYDVHVYEYREDMRRTDMAAGRSINLALSTRGMTALAVLFGCAAARLLIPAHATGRRFVGRCHADCHSHVRARHSQRRWLVCQIQLLERRQGSHQLGMRCVAAALATCDAARRCRAPNSTVA